MRDLNETLLTEQTSGKGVQRAAVFMTLGLWAFCFLTFLAAHSAGRNGWPEAWAYAWLGAVTATGMVASGALYFVVRHLPRRRATRWRWLSLALLVLLAAAAQSAVDVSLMRWIERDLRGFPPGSINGTAIVIDFLIYFWLFGFYVAALELLISAKLAASIALSSQRLAAETSQALAAAREAELQMLRTQLTPHFLFNALNGVSGLVVSGRAEEAEAMLGQLSRFLRSAFSPSTASWRTLDAELLAVETFLDLETPRFSARPELNFDIDDGVAEALVPTWILQPLIENAVKFALAPSGGKSGLTVRASEAGGELVLEVIDAGPAGAVIPQPGDGVGLTNVRRRLALLYGDDATLTTSRDEDGFRACVRLPLRSS